MGYFLRTKQHTGRNTNKGLCQLFGTNIVAGSVAYFILHRYIAKIKGEVGEATTRTADTNVQTGDISQYLNQSEGVLEVEDESILGKTIVQKRFTLSDFFWLTNST